MLSRTAGTPAAMSPHGRPGAFSQWLARASASHLPPLCVLAAVLGLGLVAMGDFGLANDQRTQYRVGQFTTEYVLGENEKLLRHNLRYYGAVFEVALQAPERLFGLTDDRDIYLSRYMLSHCFFLGGAFACYLLAHRLFQSRLLAMFAMLFFLCHPRLYGHSFYNSKDAPFLSMFMIALLLAHRALRTGRLRDYGGLGVWIGLISTVRPMAMSLVVLVFLLRCGDFVRARAGRRTQQVLAPIVLSLASVVAFFAGLPYLWHEPVGRFAEWVTLMSDHTHVVGSLFLGGYIVSDDRPWSYVPVWFSVTTPPVVTALAVLGGLAVGARAIGNPGRAFSSGPHGFEMLLAGSVIVPAVVVTFWVGNLYNGWRHLYFVYGPVCLFACAGIAWLVQSTGKRLSTLALAVAALGLAHMIVWIVKLHPHQNIYFNFLVDRKTPELLRTQFDMDYWAVSQKEALEVLLAMRPRGNIPISGMMAQSIGVLSAEQRSRIYRPKDFSAYFATDYRYWWGQGGEEGHTYAHPIYVRKVLSNTVYAIVRLQVNRFAGSRYELDYRSALANPPVSGSGRFQVYWDGNAVTYLADGCTPADVEPAHFNVEETRHLGRFFLHVVGDKHIVGDSRTDAASVGLYFHNEDFQFRHRGVVFNEGGRRMCMARVALDGYRVDAIHTGQLDVDLAPTWSVGVSTVDRTALGGALERLAGAEPVGRGGYDVHLEEGKLFYVKERCGEEDRAAPFFLHVVPSDPGEVAPSVAERGFANRDFTFATHGAMVGDACVLRARLPAFRARELRTGQYTGDGEVWRVELSAGFQSR